MTPRLPVLTALVAAAAAVVGVAFADVPGKIPPDPERGREIFRESCWQCHGWTGEGGGPVASGLSTPTPALAGRIGEPDTDAAIDVILQGRGDMPAFSAIIERPDARRVMVWLATLDPDHPVDEGDLLPEEKAGKARTGPVGRKLGERRATREGDGVEAVEGDGPDASGPGDEASDEGDVARGEEADAEPDGDDDQGEPGDEE